LARKKTQDFPLQHRESDRGGSRTRIQHKVPTSGQFRSVQPENLSDSPLDAIPNHSLPYALRHRNAQTRLGQAIRSIKDGA
jgi:hypothetical protein